jgi:hypothetical protein
MPHACRRKRRGELDSHALEYPDGEFSAIGSKRATGVSAIEAAAAGWAATAPAKDEHDHRSLELSMQRQLAVPERRVRRHPRIMRRLHLKVRESGRDDEFR